MATDIEELTREAAEGRVVAQGFLGMLYLFGSDELPVDYAKAFQLLSAAESKGGASRPRASLARMYRDGLGIPVDLDKARQLYELAARQGEFFARVELAQMYARGMGMPVDREKAAHWYKAALEKSDPADDSEEVSEARAFLQASGL